MGAGGIDDFLPAAANRDLLRFITCGSVDDGKSTLIGRLLYDSAGMLEDQLSGLEADSRRFGTTGEGELDLALLVDGLIAEREQGITIDVAYRYFTTARRKFIVADTPGHLQYTRNMATGASTADLAVLLVDARKGVVTQTRRHAYIVSLLGIRELVVAVNKMDLVGGDEAIYQEIVGDCRAFAEKLGIGAITCIPVVSLTGENISRPSTTMPWYTGTTLLDHLETVDIAGEAPGAPFRMPVQWVNRPNLDYRGFAGSVVRGRLEVGERITVLPSGQTAGVAAIETMQGASQSCSTGQAVTLLLDEAVDVSRGDVIVSASAPCEVADQFAAHLVWMGDQPMLPGRRYLLRSGTSSIAAQITEIKYRVDVDTLEHAAAKHLDLNDIGYCNLSLDRPLPFDRYRDSRAMGSFILIDRLTNATVGAGMIDFALRRSANIRWQKMKIDKRARAANTGQTPCVLWFTGLSGAGKSTIADLVEQRLHALGRQTMSLDGDNVRHGLNRDLGFTDEDRVENIRRVAEVGKLMVEAGLITLVSFISPFRSERQLARDLLEEGEFLEIFVDTPLTVCEGRDPKGLYRKARAGTLPNFTGVSSPYEPPEDPDLRLLSAERSADDLADDVIALLSQRGIL